VSQDTLGVFRSSKAVYWLPAEGGGVNLFVEYAARTPGVPGADHAMDGGIGIAARTVFFPPGASPDPKVPSEQDKLRFAGMDRNVPEYEGVSCLHFVRTVGTRPEEDGSAAFFDEMMEREIGRKVSSDSPTRPFSEDMWYAPGKGLIRLEQKVGGKTTMIWRLEEFSVGT
jgi:hypothetical protein